MIYLMGKGATTQFLLMSYIDDILISMFDAGVDVILDNIGGPYFQRNLDSLNVDGRLFIIGFMGGTVTQVNLGCLLARRLTVQGKCRCALVYFELELLFEIYH